MAMSDPDRRTELPTPRRRRQARERGRVARSRELPSAFVLLAAGAILELGGESGLRWWASLLHRLWTPESLGGSIAADWWLSVLWGLTPAALVGAVLALVGVGALLAQGGPVFSLDPLSPDPSRLSPVQGLRRMLSRQSWVNLAVNLLKTAVIAWISLATVRSGLPSLSSLNLEAGIVSLGSLMGTLLRRLGAALLVIGAADYLYQRWEFEQSLRMTREEVEREFKETEGDPRMRQRRRELHSRLTRFRVVEEVPRATAVVTNPTHYAVALRWREGIDPAPMVVAKGVDEIAVLIREIAREHGVPVMENRPLARTLYAAVEVGDMIPPEFFDAVAEFLYLVFTTYPTGRAPRVRRRGNRTSPNP